MRIQLRLPQPISIQLPLPGGSWHQTSLLEHTDDVEMVVSRPETLGEDVAVEPGTAVGVELPLPDGLRRFTVRIRSVGDSPASLRLSWPEAEERIQRRDHVRVPVELRAEVVVTQEDGSVSAAVVGQTSDLSAGGTRIDLAASIPDHAPIRIALQVPGAGKIEVDGHVVRSGELKRPTGPGGTYRVWVAVVFGVVPPAVLRDINKLLFEVQREQLRRSLA